jgi:hypothetical protein
MNAEKLLRNLRKKWARGGRIGNRSAKAAGVQIGLHNRWHRSRGIKNPKCKLCRAAAARN